MCAEANGVPDDEPQSLLGDGLRPPGPINMHVSQLREGGATVLHLTGELDILTAPQFGAKVGQLVREQKDDLVIDLRGIDFIDSAGLHILLNAKRRLGRQSRELQVVCSPGPVRRLIELSRLIETLGVVASLAECRHREAG
ncbi:MAG: STAS domain-containing protein [Solirubrobacteraceae bacterium]